MSKTSYVVTDVAGPRPDVAGRRRRAGETIALTATEAEYELSRGVIALPESKSEEKADAQADDKQTPPKDTAEPRTPKK